ncbi:sigma-54 dependent transcriptional regulator [uncultured Alistipes sp.]|uniref:sigma-54-dependent transcriptional regulator n=1 Tax=uncultured Alistipes sp. TaxID=538949 RepID=UPI002585C36A|nr:sigma-54 dependent transcriptional regulator [uncultured Alistipes sp.]
MAKEGTLLVVDDNRSILAALQLLMGNYFARVLTLPTPNRLATLLREEPIDVVLLDMNFTAGINTGNEGIYWLREIHRTRPDVKVVLFTAYADIDLAVRAMRDGAVDFVVKPWDNERLVAALRNAYNLARSQREVKQLKEIKRELKQEEPMFWGGSPAMARIREIVEKVAATDANILITGENGTGKEMLAREIHNRSARRRELMVPVDMGAVPETLFESELFGHVKGAFTDARTDRAGKFEVADRGTLFLDEIGNLPPRLQSKLLTAIQSGRIVRLGSNTPVKVDIRLISATNRDLFGMVADGEFREDLLYRINTIHIDLPPLRQRREDILPLAEKFLGRYAAKYNKPIEGFDEAAVREMHDYPWAGNIRELQHTVEKAVILCDGHTIAPATLLLRPAPAETSPKTGFSTLEEMERAMIAEAVARCGGNLTEVARQLGITRQTLYNKIKRYGL